jgi:hypothetical protein
LSVRVASIGLTFFGTGLRAVEEMILDRRLENSLRGLLDPIFFEDLFFAFTGMSADYTSEKDKIVPWRFGNN